MTPPFPIPWLELAVLVPLVGTVVAGLTRDERATARRAIGFSAAALACAAMACVGFYSARTGSESVGRPVAAPLLALDGLSAPLVPLCALLHLLTALATPRTKTRRFSFALSLANASLGTALFGAAPDQPHLTIALLAAGALPPFLDARNRGRPTGLYVAHAAVLLGALAIGGLGFDIEAADGHRPGWATAAILIAVFVRCGIVPCHLWFADLFGNCSFGAALLHAAPLPGAFAAARLLVPNAPAWALNALVAGAAITCAYAAGMTLVQRDARRFFAYLFLGQSSLVPIGLGLCNPTSVSGSLGLWFAMALALGGLGLCIRALEARLGRLDLGAYQGLYERTPALAVYFLWTGLAAIGFPGTLGFAFAELLVDGAIEASPGIAALAVVSTALNGIAVLRAYFLLFTGVRRASSIPLAITPRERFVLLALFAGILGGGLYPQPGITDRIDVAITLTQARAERHGASR